MIATDPTKKKNGVNAEAEVLHHERVGAEAAARMRRKTVANKQEQSTVETMAIEAPQKKKVSRSQGSNNKKMKEKDLKASSLSSPSHKKKALQNNSDHSSSSSNSSRSRSTPSSPKGSGAPVVYQEAGAELLTLNGSASRTAAKPHKARHSDRAPYMQNKALQGSYRLNRSVSPALRMAEVNAEHKLKVAYMQRQDSLHNRAPPKGTPPVPGKNPNNTASARVGDNAKKKNTTTPAAPTAPKNRPLPQKPSLKQKRQPRQKLFVRTNSLPTLGRGEGFDSDDGGDDDFLLFASPTVTATESSHSDTGHAGTNQSHPLESPPLPPPLSPLGGGSPFQTPPRKRLVPRRRSGSFVDDHNKREIQRGVDSHFSGSSAGSSVIGQLLESMQQHDDERVLNSPPTSRPKLPQQHKRAPSHIFLDDDSSVSSMVLRRYDLNDAQQHKLSDISLQIPADILEVEVEPSSSSSLISAPSSPKPANETETATKTVPNNTNDKKKPKKSKRGADTAATATKEKPSHSSETSVEARNKKVPDRPPASPSKPKKSEAKSSPRREKKQSEAKSASENTKKEKKTGAKKMAAIDSRDDNSAGDKKEEIPNRSDRGADREGVKAEKKKKSGNELVGHLEKKQSNKSSSTDQEHDKKEETPNHNNQGADREDVKTEKKKKSGNDLTGHLEKKQHNKSSNKDQEHDKKPKKKKRSDDSSVGSNNPEKHAKTSETEKDPSAAPVGKSKKHHSSKSGLPPSGKKKKGERDLAGIAGNDPNPPLTQSTSGVTEHTEEKDLMELLSASTPDMRLKVEPQTTASLHESLGDGLSAEPPKNDGQKKKKARNTPGEGKSDSGSSTAAKQTQSEKEIDFMELLSSSMPDMRHTEEPQTMVPLHESLGEGLNTEPSKKDSQKKKKAHSLPGDGTSNLNPDNSGASLHTSPGVLESNDEEGLMELMSMSTPNMRHTEEPHSAVSLHESLGDGLVAEPAKKDVQKRKKLRKTAGDSKPKSPWSDNSKDSNPWAEKGITKKGTRIKETNGPSHRIDNSSEDEKPRKSKEASPAVAASNTAKSKRRLKRSNSVPRWMSESGRSQPSVNVSNAGKPSGKGGLRRATKRSISHQSSRSQPAALKLQPTVVPMLSPNNSESKSPRLCMQLAYYSDPVEQKREKVQTPQQVEAMLVPPIYRPPEVKT